MKYFTTAVVMLTLLCKTSDRCSAQLAKMSIDPKFVELTPPAELPTQRNSVTELHQDKSGRTY